MSYRRRVRADEYPPREAAAFRAEGAREQTGADLKDFIAILGRNRFLIAASLAGALTLAGAYLATTGSAYTSTVSILIDARTRTPVGADQSGNPNGIPDATLVESQVKLISSDTVLRRVVQREQLVDDPDFVPTRPGLRARLFAMLGIGAKAPSGEDRTTRATASLARVIAVKRSERTYVIDVDVISGDPNKAARLANLVAEAYIEDQREARLQVSRQDSRWLTQRLSELQAKLQDAENKVQEFKVKNRITDAVGKNVREQELADLTNELGRARARAIEAKAKYDQVRRLAATGRLPDATVDALKSPVLEKLRVQYSEIARQEAHYRTTLGERHPAMLEVQNQLRDSRLLIAAELKRIGDAANNEYQQARAAETDTARRAEAARVSTDSKNQNMVQLRELDRELEAHRGVYERFLRARETMNDDPNDGPIARVIAPAAPSLAPSSPKTMAILFIALASGLCFGVGTALLREYMGRGANPRDEERARPRREAGETGVALHVIACVPRVGGQRTLAGRLKRWTARKQPAAASQTSNPVLSEVAVNPASDFSRAIADLHRALAPNAPERARAQRPSTVLVCSARENCGKTTIAVNLARMAAMSGQRALIIDANFNHPSLGDLVDPAAEPALIELAGEMRPIYRIANKEHGELRIVPIRADENQIRRSLMARASAERLRGINGSFDFVVIDGPTLSAGEQLRLVAGAVDNIVLVTAPGEASPDIDDVLDRLDVPEDRLAGAVESMSEAKRAA